jgi:hypothetical protein
MEPQSPFAGLNVSENVQRIVELQTAIDRLVRQGEYESAADLRDQRAVIEKELRKFGNETLNRNIVLLRSGMRPMPVVDLLEPKDASVDETLLQKLRIAPIPVRWIIQNCETLSIGTARRRLASDSVESAHFRARFPLISCASLGRATYAPEWIRALVQETARSQAPVVWVCAELDCLSKRGVLDLVLSYLNEPKSEFIACVSRSEAPLAKRFVDLPRAAEIWA